MLLDNEAIVERIRILEARVTALDERGSNARKEIYDRLRNIETESGRTDERYNSIMVELAEIQEQLKALSEKPAKRWDTAISTAISGIVGAIVGAIVGKGV